MLFLNKTTDLMAHKGIFAQNTCGNVEEIIGSAALLCF